MRAPKLRDSDQKLRSWEMKVWIETSKLQVETSKKFQIFLETFISKFRLFFKFGVVDWFTKQITKFVKESFKEDPKYVMKFQTEVSKFQFEVSFLTSKIPIRVSKLGGMFEPFWL